MRKEEGIAVFSFVLVGSEKFFKQMDIFWRRISLVEIIYEVVSESDGTASEKELDFITVYKCEQIRLRHGLRMFPKHTPLCVSFP